MQRHKDKNMVVVYRHKELKYRGETQRKFSEENQNRLINQCKTSIWSSASRDRIRRGKHGITV